MACPQFDNLYDFVKFHAKADTKELRLRLKAENFNFDLDFALLQIESRRKYATKLKDFIEYPDFLFPDAISGEQCSNQGIGRYHASLIPQNAECIDLTAGLGIDTFSLASKAKKLVAIEMNPVKAEMLESNSKVLGLNNISVITGDSMDYLSKCQGRFDIIFADPSRRDDKQNRVFNLRDCSPDVITNQNTLTSKGKLVIIKASPLLDISQTIADFENISSIQTVGVKGECKEVLVILSQEKTVEDFPIKAVNLDTEGNVTSELTVLKSQLNVSLSPGDYAEENDLKEEVYILEPSAMVMKIAPWKLICEKYNAKKIGPSSHIFITPDFPVDFPGRATRLVKLINKQDRKILKNFPASVISRNYPMSADEIRSKFHLKEGDNNFIYATRLANHPIMLLSERVSTT